MLYSFFFLSSLILTCDQNYHLNYILFAKIEQLLCCACALLSFHYSDGSMIGYRLFMQEGLSVLAKYRRPLLVHAEIQLDSESHLELNTEDARSYSTYLKTRPPEWQDFPTN